MQKTIQCKMNGHLTELPCPASGCPSFGDCLVEYEKAQKPMTNADRIRSMSDEELARIFVKAPLCRASETKVDCRQTKSCLQCLTEWLKQPAEEGQK